MREFAAKAFKAPIPLRGAPVANGEHNIVTTDLDDVFHEMDAFIASAALKSYRPS